jgi:hypothetical protein
MMNNGQLAALREACNGERLMDKYLKATQVKAQAGKCEGACDKHVDPVQTVHVVGKDDWDWGYWAYCQTAQEDDRANEFTVTVVE